MKLAVRRATSYIGARKAEIEVCRGADSAAPAGTLMNDVVKMKPARALAPDTRPSREEAEAAVRTLIAWAGDDPDREGLADTPRRVARAYEELFSGYHQDPAKPLMRVFREVSGYDDLVLVRDIGFRFALRAPHGAVLRQGAYRLLSARRRGRPLEAGAHRRCVRPPAADAGGAVGADRRGDRRVRSRRAASHVMIEAEHTCMAMRGVSKQGASTVTTQFTGVFREDRDEQTRFFNLLRGAGR